MFCSVGATLSCGLESRLHFQAFSLQLIYICIRRPPPLFFPAFSETSVTIISSSSSSSSSSLSLSIFHSPLLLSAFRLIASLSVRRSAHLSSILRGSATRRQEADTCAPSHVVCITSHVSAASKSLEPRLAHAPGSRQLPKTNFPFLSQSPIRPHRRRHCCPL